MKKHTLSAGLLSLVLILSLTLSGCQNIGEMIKKLADANRASQAQTETESYGDREYRLGREAEDEAIRKAEEAYAEASRMTPSDYLIHILVMNTVESLFTVNTSSQSLQTLLSTVEQFTAVQLDYELLSTAIDHYSGAIYGGHPEAEEARKRATELRQIGRPLQLRITENSETASGKEGIRVDLQYDSEGKLISWGATVIDGSSVSSLFVSYTYNRQGQLTGKAFSVSGTSRFSWTETYAYDAAGRMIRRELTAQQEITVTVTETRTYDAAGRLLSETVSAAGAETAMPAYNFRFSWNEDGSLKSIEYSAGAGSSETVTVQVSFRTAADKKSCTVSLSVPGNSESMDYLCTLDAKGRLLKFYMGTDTELLSREYSENGGLSSQRTFSGNSGFPIETFSTHDRFGQTTSSVTSLNYGGGFDSRSETAYTYDAYGLLSQVVYTVTQKETDTTTTTTSSVTVSYTPRSDSTLLYAPLPDPMPGMQ